MSILNKLNGLALSLIVALSACDMATSVLDDDNGIVRSVRYQPPIPDWDDDKTDPELTLEISEGQFMLDGNAVSRADVSDIAASSRSDGWTRVAVLPATEARFGDVAEKLETLATPDGGGFVILGSDQHRRFGEANGAGAAANVIRDFRGSIGEYELPIIVEYAEAQDACIVSIAGSVYDSEGFYDQAFFQLDSWVKRAGGIEAFMADPEILSTVVARIQSTQNTPWYCIGGAMYHLEVAGLPYIQLELVGDEQ